MNNEFVCLKDKFRLLQEIKKLIIYSDTHVYSNFPKEKKHLKIAYFDAVNNLFEYTLRANNTSGNVRNKNQNEYILNSSNQFKPLFCEELHRVFLSARRVEQKIGIKRLAIQKAMQKGYKTCGGYHWKEIKKHRFNNYGR